MKITGILLAAGTSMRMGSLNKLLLKYKDHTVMEEAVQQLSDSRVDDILVVTGFEHTLIEELIADRLTDRMRIVHNGNFRLGRSESIKCGIRHISGKTDAALFMVADKPSVTSTLIDKAIDCFKRDKPKILYVRTPTGRGHPIIFSSTLFDDLLSLKGDRVGNDLIEKYKDELVELKDETAQIDVDNETDYNILLKDAVKNTS